MTGVELVRAMRERPDLRALPVVFVSGAADAANVREALALGPAGYILKPIHEPSRVIERVNHALRGVLPLLADPADVRRARGLDMEQYRQVRSELEAALRAALEGGEASDPAALASQAHAVGGFRLAGVMRPEGRADRQVVVREMRALLSALEARV